MGCSNKIKHTCVDSMKAECVDYEGTVNSQSELIDEGCLSIEDTTQDIYNQLEEIDVTDIDDCLEYAETDGKILIKDVVKKHGEEICLLKEQLETLEGTAICDTVISGCGIDFSCLETQCGNEIQTLKDWIQAVTNKICTTP